VRFKKYFDILNSFGVTPDCVGQTDGQTDKPANSICGASVRCVVNKCQYCYSSCR